MSRYGFEQLRQQFNKGADRQLVFEQASLRFGPLERVAVLGPPGSGKTVLHQLFLGRMAPAGGLVYRPPAGQMSWRVGFAGLFHPGLTGEQNIRTLSAMIGADVDATSAFVGLFSELDDAYYRPLQSYSSGMRARLGFAFSMAIPFAFYVADDVIGTGDERFRVKCERMMLKRLDRAGLLFTTRSVRLAERFADRFAVIHNHQLIACETADEARALLAEAMEDDEMLEAVVAGFASA